MLSTTKATTTIAVPTHASTAATIAAYAAEKVTARSCAKARAHDDPRRSRRSSRSFKYVMRAQSLPQNLSCIRIPCTSVYVLKHGRACKCCCGRCRFYGDGKAQPQAPDQCAPAYRLCAHMRVSVQLLLYPGRRTSALNWAMYAVCTRHIHSFHLCRTHVVCTVRGAHYAHQHANNRVCTCVRDAF